MELLIKEIAHHRNGIGGNGFYAVLFEDVSETPFKCMVATVFEEVGSVAVLDVGLLRAGIVTFGQNSWRGDRYEPDLRKVIDAWEKRRDEQFTAQLRRSNGGQ